MQGKWSELFLQRPPLCSHSSWLWAGLYVCQLALKRVPHMHSHAHVMNLWIMLSCLFHSSYTAASWFLHTQRGNILYHNYGINAAEKGFGGGGGRWWGTNCEEKRSTEREVVSCFMWKEKGCTPTRMKGWFDLQLPPRWSVGVWSWLASWSRLGEKVLEELWPLLTLRQAPHDLGSLDAPSCASVMQSILVRHQTTDVASCWLHLPGDPWPGHHT